jgi:hypothetical protein
MGRTYAALGSYQDHGSLSLVAGTTESVVAEFRTAFARTAGLRFSFSLLKGSNAGEIAFRTDSRIVIESRGFRDPQKSIRNTLGRLVGVTFGVTHTVPPMLWLEASLTQRLCDAEDAELLRVEDLGSNRCFVVAFGKTNSRMTVFIREDNFALMRTVLQSTTTTEQIEQIRARFPNGAIPDFERTTTTTVSYEPTFGSAALPDILEW